MRLRRMLAEGVGYYHVISRIAGQQFLVDDREILRVCPLN